MDSLLIVGDAGCDTGFARVVHELTKQLFEQWDVHILAVNYYGDPHSIQQYARLYPASAYRSSDLGVERLEYVIKRAKPKAILVICDPWTAGFYVPILQDYPDIKKCLYTPVDSRHIKRGWIEPLQVFDEVIAYTEFGKKELLFGGLEKDIHVIPHGINTTDFHPIDRNELRAKSSIDTDWFVVQSVGRNSMRKRQDLLIYYFSEWVKLYDRDQTIKLYYHGDLQDFNGYDITDLVDYYGVNNRFIRSPKHTAANGLPIEMMNAVYNLADVHISTAGGEG